MTQIIDPNGNTETIQYDAQRRITSVIDSLGQVSMFGYSHPSDVYKLTSITDPFGRTAGFSYDSNGRLTQITDVIGLKSQFTYGPTTQHPEFATDFVNTLTTPYGQSTFVSGQQSTTFWLDATDPMGSTERWEFRHQAPGVIYSEETYPAGMLNRSLYWRNTFYWNKRVYALHAGDYTKAQLIQWLHDNLSTDTVAAVEQSSKEPDESRIWYAYPGQSPITDPSGATFNTAFTGTDSLPARISRLLPDGSEQNQLFEYNAWGKVTKSTDPAGRQTTNIYSTDGIDLLEVRNTTAGANELLAKYTYSPQHKPLTATDAAGQVTTFTYNGFGQVLTITNPRNETTTFAYDPIGYLQTITGAITGATTSFTYDGKGRVHTVTGPDGLTTTTTYDDFDRTMLVEHADGTTEQMVYDRLDLWKTKDREGRWTVMSYNPLRQLVEVQDPLGRITHFDWCGCGSQLESLTDPKGQTTTWMRDLGGKVVAKILADQTQTVYTYDSAGRLAQRTDAMGQQTRYRYAVDNSLLEVSYPNALKPTPTASYTYDPKYNRLATSSGAFGTTTYTYNPIEVPPALGAGRLASIAGPWANSTITYTYDNVGRVRVRGINGSSETRDFDALGRLGTVANPLGTFSYQYDGVTSRLKQVDAPNGMKTVFDYFTASQEFRLKSIDHQKASGTSLSTHAYTYTNDGQIHTWSQGADAQPPKVWTFTYDAVNQLTDAVLNGPTGALIRQFGYGYDLMGNRTSESVDGATTTATHNTTNQLTGQRHALNSAAIIRKREDDARKARAPKPATATTAPSHQ